MREHIEDPHSGGESKERLTWAGEALRGRCGRCVRRRRGRQCRGESPGPCAARATGIDTAAIATASKIPRSIQRVVRSVRTSATFLFRRRSDHHRADPRKQRRPADVLGIDLGAESLCCLCHARQKRSRSGYGLGVANPCPTLAVAGRLVLSKRCSTQLLAEVNRVGGDGFVLGGGPAREQVQGFLAPGADLGVKTNITSSGVGGERHHLVRELELPDEWMLDAVEATTWAPRSTSSVAARPRDSGACSSSPLGLGSRSQTAARESLARTRHRHQRGPAPSL